jgi:hypothetical protein
MRQRANENFKKAYHHFYFSTFGLIKKSQAMKYKAELLIILVVSIVFAVLLPGFMLDSKTIVLKSIPELIITSLGIFVLLTLAYFAFKKSKN